MTEVAVATYRADMRAWHDRVRRGERVVVTERGRPIVQLVPVDEEDGLARLERQGLLRRGENGPRPVIKPIGAYGDSTDTADVWRR